MTSSAGLCQTKGFGFSFQCAAHVSDLVTTTITGESPATFRLDWRVDADPRARLEDHIFGKRILITDRRDWTVAEIIAGYRSQSDAEFGFRQLKDPHVVSFSPMHHWTEIHIRVHVFSCILALTVAHLMRRHAAHHGLDLSVRTLLDALAGIEETVLLYPGDIFELRRWAPAS